MGNSPSSSKAATPTASTLTSPHDSSRPAASRRDHRPMIPIHHQQRSAASPEASAVQAQGSTISNRSSQSRPLSILHQPSPSSSSTPPRALEPQSRSQPHSQQPPNVNNAPSQPVAVPVAHSDEHAAYRAPESDPQLWNLIPMTLSHSDSQYEESVLTSGANSSSVQDLSYQMSRPPRLPLPIEEEIHTPGSPIVDAVEPEVPVEVEDDGLEESSGRGPRRASSGLSCVTDDDESEELRVDKTRPTVPTRIEWLQGGYKVYVTGTPFQWSKKQRLHPVKNRDGILQTIIDIYPGTHHIKFLVDGNMETSPHLPTTVDFGNNLVNYIEVSGEEAGRELGPELASPSSNKEVEALPSRQPSQIQISERPKKSMIPVEEFSEDLPPYLADFDQAEESPAYKLSAIALEKLGKPPSLPGFLSKPILNHTALIKDDNSVLNMPNHTVLNHLGTSSIKNNVLAVSATTRYRSKYVTTIIYKPTTE